MTTTNPLTKGMLGHIGFTPVHSSALVPAKVPKIQLSPNIDVSPEFRAQFDAKMLEWFGEKTVVFVMGSPLGRGIYGAPEVIKRLSENMKS